MTYIIGEQFHGNVGQLDSRLVGSIEADSPELARLLAEERWPKLKLCVYEVEPSGYRTAVALGQPSSN
jgi:hypothetical protein